MRIVGLEDITSVKASPRGRPQGTQLGPQEAATTVRLLINRYPDQLELPLALRTRAAVQRRLATSVSPRRVSSKHSEVGLYRSADTGYDTDPTAYETGPR